MALLICFVVGSIAGILLGGRTSLRYARQYEFAKANKALRGGAIAAGGFAALCTTLTLGWPMKQSQASVPEEVTRTIIETVQVVVEVPKWIFFKTTKIEDTQVPKEITETVLRSTTVSEFSIWLTIPMIVVGFIGSRVYKVAIRLAWRWFPSRQR